MPVHIRIKGLRENFELQAVATEIAKTFGVAESGFISQLMEAIDNPEQAKPLLENIEEDEAELNCALFEAAGLNCYTLPAKQDNQAASAQSQVLDLDFAQESQVESSENSNDKEIAASLEKYKCDELELLDLDVAENAPPDAAPDTSEHHADAKKLFTSNENLDIQPVFTEAESDQELPAFASVETAVTQEPAVADLNLDINPDTTTADKLDAESTTAQPDHSSFVTDSPDYSWTNNIDQEVIEIPSAGTPEASIRATPAFAAETSNSDTPLPDNSERKKYLTVASGIGMLAVSTFLYFQIAHNNILSTTDKASQQNDVQNNFNESKQSDIAAVEFRQSAPVIAGPAGEVEEFLRMHPQYISGRSFRSALIQAYSINEIATKQRSIKKVFSAAELNPDYRVLLRELATNPPPMSTTDRNHFNSLFLAQLLESREDKAAIAYLEQIKSPYLQGLAASRVVRTLAGEPKNPAYLTAFTLLEISAEETDYPIEKAEIYNNLATAFTLKGDPETAQTWLDKAFNQAALALNVEQRVEVLGKIAEDRVYFGDEEMANRIFDSMLKFADAMSKYNPEKPNSYRHIALSHARSNNFQSARQATTKITDLELEKQTLAELVEIALDIGNKAMAETLSDAHAAKSRFSKSSDNTSLTQTN